MNSRLLHVGTDAATLALFHPDDLWHRAGAPLDWCSYGFAYHPEAAAGRLIAFHTVTDAGFNVRVTMGPLTPDEDAHRRGNWAFPFLVRHGRVLLDGMKALPSRGCRGDAWYDVPNGTHRVTMHSILPEKADEDADNTLPRCVVALVDGLDSVPAAPTPPYIQDWDSGGVLKRAPGQGTQGGASAVARSATPHALPAPPHRDGSARTPAAPSPG